MAVSKQAVLLTVPHAFCRKEWLVNIDKRAGRHLCDNLALQAAECLFREIRRTMPKHDVTIVYPKTERSLCDLNRVLSRKPCYQQFIHTWLGQKSIRYGANNVWLLDVHSFPAGRKSYGDEDADVVILDPHADRKEFEPFSLSLHNALQQLTPIRVKLLKGKGNEISETALDFNIGGATLLEFNEELPGMALNAIARIIAVWLASWARLVQQVESTALDATQDMNCPCRFCFRSQDDDSYICV